MRPRSAIKNKAAAVLHSPAPRPRVSAPYYCIYFNVARGQVLHAEAQKTGSRERGRVREQPQGGGGKVGGWWAAG